MRPLSPHISIYRWPANAMLSILHRITGTFLGVSCVFLVWWLIAIADGADAYEVVRGLCGSLVGQAILAGAAWALFYHLCNGLRHLAWDAGFGYSPDLVIKSGWIAVAVSIALTLLTFILALV